MGELGVYWGQDFSLGRRQFRRWIMVRIAHNDVNVLNVTEQIVCFILCGFYHN